MNGKERIEYLDIAKGIGIMLVVWFHAHGPFFHYFSLFHMPLFFLISGFLYNPDGTFKQFVWRKTKALYIPFVFWNMVIYLLRHLNRFYLSGFLKHLKRVVFTIGKDGDYLGAIWFLGALFTESVLYKFLDAVLKKIKYKRVIITLFFVIRAVIAFHINMPYRLSRTMILGMFFAIGYVIKENQGGLKPVKSPVPAFLSFILVAVIGTFTEYSMNRNVYSSVPLFITGALAGSYLVIWIAKQIDRCKTKRIKPVKRFCCLLSRESIHIVIWHFIFIRLVTFIQILVYRKPLANIIEYGNRYKTENGWWLLYFITGITIPVLWGRFLKAGIWGKFFKKIHAIR